MKQVERFFLEQKIPRDRKIIFNQPNNLEITLETNDDFKINKFFYKIIGKDHYWKDRLIWSDQQWNKYVKNPNLETWVLKFNDNLIGYYEKENHIKENEVELINMGILKEYRGKKFGKLLLEHLIHDSFLKKYNRVWVHTCSLDHKYALKNYLARDFKIFKKEKINYVA
ncbi:MAG: hypothetical protein CBD76_01820 [Pelagibacteraceae bacterium TMED216]|nr:MAG: hypothetical protein CBD76_01820 [Pelagibacteraceae bacterium TMED216]|tara:strand:- start:4523 stop:5029 length:507 start_codon:yes stop_codon:yes gene_type:complete